MRILSKLLNLPVALGIRFWKRANPWLLRSRGVVFGRNVVIPGRVNISGGVNSPLVIIFTSLRATE